MKRLLLFTFFLFSSYFSFAQFFSSPIPYYLDHNNNGYSTYTNDINGNFGQFKTINCNNSTGEVTVKAQFGIVGDASDYRVEQIPYSPVRFGFDPTLPGQQINPFQDDMFFDIYDLGDFNFCFYGNSFNKFIMNDNGIVSFDLTSANSAVSGDPSIGGWRLYYNNAEAAIAGRNPGDPIQLGSNGNQFLKNNTIYLPGHDLYTTNLPAGSEFYWNVYGNAPYRRLVIGLLNIPLYINGCNLPPQTHQIILYETTNIIEVHIQQIDICATWNPGPGYTLLGIQNEDRTKSAVVPGKDTGVWDASFESYRFIPDGGPTQTEFRWYKNYDYATHTGDLVYTAPDMTDAGLTYTFNPTETTTYVGETRYVEACTGNLVYGTREFTIVVDRPIVGHIVDASTQLDAENITLCNGDDFTMQVVTTVDPSIPDPIIGYEWVDATAPGTPISTTDSYAIPQPTSGNHTYNVTVTLYEADGTTINCQFSDTINVNFVGAEVSSFTYPSNSYCAETDQNPLPANVVTPGGTFTIQYADGTAGGVIDPATGLIDLDASGNGNFIVTYTSPNTSCGSSTTFALSIETGTPSINYNSTYCVTAGDITPVSFSPNTGTFSIDNGATIDSSTGVVDISSVTAGQSYQVDYVTLGACGGTVTDTFTVTASADATFSYATPVCLGNAASLVPDNINSTGGTFTISGTGGVIDATTGSLAGSTAGTYDVTYTTTGCVASLTISVTVNAEETATFTLPASVCKGDGNVTPTLDATATTGGTFTINPAITIDANTGEIDVSSATGGITYTVTYATPAPCIKTEQHTITINDEDIALFANTSLAVCINDATVVAALDATATTGGTFTINNGGVINVSTGEVNVTASGMGTDNTGVFHITYDTTSLGNPCPNNTTITLTITALDATDFAYDNGGDITDGQEDFCVSDVTATPNPAPATTGGTFSITSGGTIDPVTGEVDLTSTPPSNTPYIITYTTSGSCANSSTFEIVLHNDQTATFNYDVSYCKNAAANPTPTNSGTLGGTYSITHTDGTAGGTIDSSSGEVDLATTDVGNYTITYVTPGPFCTDSDTYDIAILDSPDITPPANATENACGTFTFPSIQGTGLTGNEAYYTQPNGGGTVYHPNDVLNYDATATYPITIYIYDHTNTNPDCEDQESFDLNIYPIPTANAPTSNLESCDDGITSDAIATASFGTSLLEQEILGNQNAADFTVTFADAQGNALSITNPFTSTTQTITATVTNNTTNCSETVDFTLTVLPLPEAHTPTSNLHACDVNENGIGTFDTSLLEQEILGNQNAADFTVTFTDAQSNALIITNPFTSVTQTVTATVTNNTTGCFNTVDFDFTVDPLPVANMPTSNLQSCDDGNASDAIATASFNTSLLEAEILGNQNAADFTVTFADALGNALTVMNPFTSETQTITATVTNNTTNCSKIVDFTLSVLPLPEANAPNTSYLSVCDDGTGTNTATFDTQLLESDILGTQNPSDFTITYTDDNDNPVYVIIPLFTYTFPAGESTLNVTATVTNNTSLCSNTVDFIFTKIDPDVSNFTYDTVNGHICISDTNPFPVYPEDTSNLVFGGKFSIAKDDGTTDGASINSNTGEIDLSTVNAGTTYIITYDTTDAPLSVCPSQHTFTLTIDAEVFADFTYPNSLECIDAENPLPVFAVNTLLGGSFSIDPPTMEIDESTGELNLATGEAGVEYTISYTTPDTSTCSDTKTFNVKVIGLPEFDLPINVFLCPNQDTALIEVQNPQADYTYEWVNAEDPSTVIAIGNSFEAPAVGIYGVTATEPENLCTQTKIVQVSLAEQAIIANVFVNDFNRPNNSITVDVQGGTGDFTYYLIDQDGNETVQVNNPVFENLFSNIYTIRVEDNQGCSVAVEQNGIYILDYPRFFTPNGDASNEYWQIENANIIPNSKIYIFDRFGKVMAKIDPNGLGWDGLYLGKPVPATDYWFRAEYVDPNTNLPRTAKGHFSIVRKSPF